MTDMRATERDQGLVPRDGTIWLWSPHEQPQRVVISQTKWNGEEWWVGSRNLDADDNPSEREDWNELYRWMENCVLIGVPDE